MPVKQPLWLGVDVGTQHARALVVDDEGQVFGAGSAGLRSTRRGSRHQQDPNQWWGAVAEATCAALANVRADAVAALAVAATSGTVLLVDSAGHPRTEALMYDDTRAAQEALVVDDVGAPLWHALGYGRMQPSWALPKLLWLLNSHPDLENESVRLCHQADLITARFIGHPVPTDTSNALKAGYHLIEDRWPGEVLDRLGIPPTILPAVVRPGTLLGRVSVDASTVTGVPAGTPVVAGMTDGCAAQLGAGCVETGSWNSVLGTTLVLKGVSDQLVRDPAGALYCHRGPGNTWLPGGASSSGAGAITEWFAGVDLADLTARAAALPIGPVMYPLIGRGERFPFRADDAETFMLGHPDTDAGVFAALLLGVACLERLCFDRVTMLGAPADGRLTFTGGATRNEYWTQLRADLLGRTVQVPDQPEPALGMAILASTSNGKTLVEAAAAMVRGGSERAPNPARGAVLRQRYADFVEELTARGWLDTAIAQYARARL
ncbi:carbohydrate kinase [Mycolicibacterium fortuitum]|nr:carbohydrate kinase [Mycolicibacterium fortuitum]NOP95449.1 carbohydrate kinase [Mycolicibacterium fortuitum]